MKIKSLFLYLVVGCVGVVASFFISIQFFPHAQSQESTVTSPQTAAADAQTETSQGAQAPDQATAQLPTEVPVNGPSTEEVMAKLNSENYVYDPTGKRDPFKVYEGFLKAEKKAQLQQGIQTKDPLLNEDPLQRSDISAFTVVGILWDVKNPRALVKDSREGIYTVSRNTKIGLNDGYVAMIREGEIVVVETFHEDGQARKQTKILSLGKQ